MMVRHEQINARGEASRPRVDLNALGALPRPGRPGRRDASLSASGRRGDPRPRTPLTWRGPYRRACGKSGRSGPDQSATSPLRPHPEMTTMQMTVTIHEAWLARPEDLRHVLALLAGLEIPPPGSASVKAAGHLRSRTATTRPRVL